MSNTNQRKKDIIQQYKEKKTTGGVYSITNNKNGNKHLFADVDLQACKNRFEFAKITGSCVIAKLQREWDECGKDAFCFEIIEEIEKADEETLPQFREDLKCLLEMCQEKLKNN